MSLLLSDFIWALDRIDNIFSHQDMINISNDNGGDKIAEIDRICDLRMRALRKGSSMELPDSIPGHRITTTAGENPAVPINLDADADRIGDSSSTRQSPSKTQGDGSTPSGIIILRGPACRTSHCLPSVGNNLNKTNMVEQARAIHFGLNRLACDIEAHDSSVAIPGEITTPTNRNTISEISQGSDISPSERWPGDGFDDLFRSDD